MKRTLNHYMANIPIEIGREIFSFLIPESKNITFYSYSTNRYSNSSYHPRYEKAFIDDDLVKNENGFYLSRISKKNGKHRYYITEEIVDVIHVENNDQLCRDYYYEYISTYVGKNLDNALVTLYLSL